MVACFSPSQESESDHELNCIVAVAELFEIGIPSIVAVVHTEKRQGCEEIGHTSGAAQSFVVAIDPR
jgi:hypothetical protein